MICEDWVESESLAYNYVCYHLDAIDELSPVEIDSRSRALAHKGAPIIMPLSRIWAEGHIGFLKTREDRLGLFFIGAGVILIFAGTVVMFNATALNDCVISVFLLIVGSVLSVMGSIYGRAVDRRVARAKRRAARARYILNSMTDPAFAPRMMEACYNTPNQKHTRSVFIEPIGQLLAGMLPFADSTRFADPSMQIRMAIKQLLTTGWQSESNFALVREVIHLVGRAGMTEYVGEIKRIAQLSLSPFLQRPAQTCLATLNGIIEKQRVAELLLRPSRTPLQPVDLLRPVVTGATERSEVLLRPAGDD